MLFACLSASKTRLPSFLTKYPPLYPALNTYPPLYPALNTYSPLYPALNTYLPLSDTLDITHHSVFTLSEN